MLAVRRTGNVDDRSRFEQRVGVVAGFAGEKELRGEHRGTFPSPYLDREVGCPHEVFVRTNGFQSVPSFVIGVLVTPEIESIVYRNDRYRQPARSPARRMEPVFLPGP
jgi:hypothetical protein